MEITDLEFKDYLKFYVRCCNIFMLVVLKTLCMRLFTVVMLENCFLNVNSTDICFIGDDWIRDGAV